MLTMHSSRTKILLAAMVVLAPKTPFLDKSKNSEREKERNKKGTSLPNSNLYSELQKRIILPLIQIGQFQIFLLYARQDGTLLN